MRSLLMKQKLALGSWVVSVVLSLLALLLPPMEKGQLFRGVIAGGILPRKTFSMGHAREKRYYLEGRKII